ncbi:MAG: tetratricopeptide repeat protein [Phycisphaerales bacterium]
MTDARNLRHSPRPRLQRSLAALILAASLIFPASASHQDPADDPDTSISDPVQPVDLQDSSTPEDAAIPQQAPVPPIPEFMQAASKKRLAELFTRQAREIIRLEPLSVPAMEIASVLLQIAHDLAPEDEQILRIYADAQRLLNDDAIRPKLTAAIAQLDPKDEFIRLERINDVLNRYQTAGERMTAIERLLDPANMKTLGQAVASRLAFDLALLYQRQGDVDNMATWLGRASTIDQTNKDAATMAAGFFDVRISDPFAAAELLVNALMSDPTDVRIATGLANHLLNNGAYNGATRLLRLSVLGHKPAGQTPSNDLLADLALAQWAGGDSDAALSTIRGRRRDIDEAARMRAWRERPGMTAAERSEIFGPVPLTLGTVELAIRQHHDPDRINTVISGIEGTIRTDFKAIENIPAEERAQVLLTLAMLKVWLGSDAEGADAILREAATIMPLTEDAQARFGGWLALRRGDAAGAIALFEPVAEKDAAAALGLALAQIEAGNSGIGGEMLQKLARSQPGTVMGVWAREKVESMFQSTLQPSELSTRLERLASSIPKVIDRWPTAPTHLMSVRVEPVKPSFGPYEPVLLRVQVSNNSGMPLGVGPNAAIQRNIIVQPRLTVSRRVAVDEPAPIVIDIGKRLRLNPGDRIDFMIDLRLDPFASLLDAFCLTGTSIELRSTVNPRALSSGAIATGMMGSTFRTPVFRVDGVEVTPEWVDNAIDSLAELDSKDDVVTTALLLRLVAVGGATTAIPQEQIHRAADAVAEVFSRFDPYSQAWLVSQTVNHPELGGVLEMAQSSDNTYVRLAHLVKHAVEPTDPILQAARRSEDELLRRTAELMFQFIDHFQRLQNR